MSVATALVTGNDPRPALVEAAIAEALARAGLTRAEGVLLFLTPEFARHAAAAVQAAARAASCLQVTGGVFAGVCTETAWALDRPAAAVLVLGDGLALAGPPAVADAPLLCLAGGAFPPAWRQRQPRFGLIHGGPSEEARAIWQQGRLAAQHHAEARITGAALRIGVSHGLRPAGAPSVVAAADGYDLVRLGERSAYDALLRALPAELRQRDPLPLHQIQAWIRDDATPPDADSCPATGLIAANGDHSITLAGRAAPGQYLSWAVRTPLTAEADMRATLARLGDAPPAFAVFASCIGRGPYFYGGDDRDLAAVRAHWPGVPLIGAYGGGQIAPFAEGNRLLQNTVVIARADR